jgi:cytochrome c556
MLINKIIKTSLLTACLWGGASAPTIANDIDDAIKIRKVVMASMRWAGMNIMGAAIPENKRQEQNFVGQARQFAASAEMIPIIFKTKALGRDSSVKTHVMELEEIWTNWETFTKQADQMLADALAVEALAKAGDYAGAKAAAGKAFKNNCKACHDKYQDN